MSESEIEVIEGSSRETVALAIRRRQLLAEEAVLISDLALNFGVQTADHREMDRAGVPLEARTLPRAMPATA